MSTETQAPFILREKIIAMLSDNENAKVSTAETSVRLAVAEEYLDLEKLEKGILKADSDRTVMGRVLPRKSVHEKTWTNIVALLTTPEKPTITVAPTAKAAEAQPTPLDVRRAIWIDHKEARVFTLRAESAAEETFTAPEEKMHHKHPHGDKNAKAHPDDEKRFFHEIVKSLTGLGGILVVGPSTAKLEFLRYLHAHEAGLEKQIVGVETVDHPTDGQMIAYANKYFGAVKQKH